MLDARLLLPIGLFALAPLALSLRGEEKPAPVTESIKENPQLVALDQDIHEMYLELREGFKKHRQAIAQQDLSPVEAALAISEFHDMNKEVYEWLYQKRGEQMSLYRAQMEKNGEGLDKKRKSFVENKSLSVGSGNISQIASVSFGVNNDSSGNSFSRGNGNYTSYISNSIGGYNDVSYRSCAIGSNNYVSNGSIAIGNDNNVSSFSNRGSISIVYNNSGGFQMDKALLLGSHLIPNSYSTIVGAWNDPTTFGGKSFVVGCGTDANNRANGLEVHSNGTVLINKIQGDISMGIYGN